MRTARAVPNGIAVKEDHDLADDLLLGPGVRDAFGADGTDARHFPKPSRFGLDDVEHLFSELLPPARPLGVLSWRGTADRSRFVELVRHAGFPPKWGSARRPTRIARPVCSLYVLDANP